MKLTKDTAGPQNGKKFVSRADAVFLMIASSAAAVLTTVLTVLGIVGYFTGPVTLELPIASTQRTVSGLELESAGHFTALEATVPVLPTGPGELLAWGAALNQVGMLAILALVFMLAYRLRSAILFSPGSVWIVGACGAVLALAGTVGQVLDGWGRARLAELIAANERTPGQSYSFSAQFDLWPLAVGLVLMLVAGVFQYGRRLQTDTEGLV
ncbi:hypothetical protein [Pseudarthrobacter sulfonivorans]|uniref:hypothetical protein n=1 Tax=Pseudarthrobacter sulfonivorans TaxID=121292 RepID=UPI00285E9B99|nr:hypothetical protein [Pseudarthrobacter sulfonivorans]MDR6413361.1 putative membrane protein [Pseudarthrobacter sulfonivorans]